MQILIKPRSQVSSLLDPGLLETRDVPEAARGALDGGKQVLLVWAVHFEGIPREAYDVPRLRELVHRMLMARIDLTMAGLQDPAGPCRELLETFDHELRLLSGESERAVALRQQGDPATRSGALARRFNDQLTLYAAHCADRSRDARRPGLLWRIVANLDELAAEMADAGLAAAEDGPVLHQPLERVRRHRETLRLEAQKVSAVHFELAPRARLAALFRERAVLHGEWAAATCCDDQQFRLFCDRLDEIAVQLAEVARCHHQPSVEELLRQVRAELWERYQSGVPHRRVTPLPAGPLVQGASGQQNDRAESSERHDPA